MGEGRHQLAESGHLFALYQLGLSGLQLLEQLGQLLVLRLELDVPQPMNLRFVPTPLSLKADLEIANPGTGFFAENFLAQAVENAFMLQSAGELSVPFVDF